MIKNKYGFTLAEIMISIMIIGVIAAISIPSIKIVKTSYAPLAYFAHKNIVDMVGILYSGITTSTERTKYDCTPNAYYEYGRKCPQSGKYYKTTKLGVDGLIYESSVLPSMVTHCSNSKGKIVNVLKTDGEMYASTVNCSERIQTQPNSNLFCKSIVALANTSGKYDCSNLLTPSVGDNNEPSMEINESKPNFTLTNGMRFYLSKWAKSPKISSDYGYRLIAVDLNGKKGPNKEYNKSDKTIADIVTFLVLDNGEVYPLGVAGENVKVGSKRSIQYLNARVKGYYFSHYKTGQNDLGQPQRQVIQRDTTPSECSNAKDSKYKCNFGVVPLVHKVNGKDTTNFSYKEALCTAKKDVGVEYANYCSAESFSQSTLCPPTTSEKSFDLCKVETVKPAFRYNFR